SKYELEDCHENYVVASLSKKWKDYKERLKKEYFNPDGDNTCPHQFIVEEQWKNLVQHSKSDTAKRISEINKGNHAKQQMVSTTGPKSIAIQQQEYMEQMEQKMSLIQTFKVMYTKKNGEPSTDFAVEKFVFVHVLAS
ncbi:hypothetical protein Taro_054970, partial [Colocasia esculenta]|nr:hypothetical protein [Colocasia esculenta]